MAELFKFRCFQCQKLIGAPPSKYGKVVNCPRCGVELIVPSPDDETPPAEEPDPDAFRPEDFGIKLETDLISRPKPSATAGPEPVGPDPIAFLQHVAEAGEAPEPESQDQPASGPGEFQDEANAADLPEPATEPLVARRRGQRRSTLIEPTIRARDVVLPRTAAVAWALFGLLALAFAFTSGLFVGHYLWK
jgi:DNA-directed RNA polymerase subunit RPC12/RpoP